MISIIIPTYNREKFIANAIKSCLSQTYEYIEIISYVFKIYLNID